MCRKACLLIDFLSVRVDTVNVQSNFLVSFIFSLAMIGLGGMGLWSQLWTGSLCSTHAETAYGIIVELEYPTYVVVGAHHYSKLESSVADIAHAKHYTLLYTSS